MAEIDATADSQALQFDRVVTESPSSPDSSAPAVACAACHTSIDTEYYQINGSAFCDRCRQEILAMAETPRGIAPLLTAGLYGLGAGIVGAAIYYGVIAITNFEIGLVAILIGYMVGYAIRKGARGRGGRRFQVLAVALTYASVALAYAPLAVKGALEADQTAQEAPVSPGTASTGSTGTTTVAGVPIETRGLPRQSGEAATAGAEEPSPPAEGSLLLATVFLLGIVAILPVLVVAGSFPSGLISALIIFFGMRQAWTMTGAPSLEVAGPYRVGSAPAPTAV